MSLSTDMSGSDDLSLDGSDSNLIVEAAKASAERQRLGKSEEKGDTESESGEDTTHSEPTQSDADSIGNRATLQLTPAQVDADLNQAEISDADEDVEQARDLEKAEDTFADEAANVQEESKNGEEQPGLLSMQQIDEPTQDLEDDVNHAVSDEGSSEDNFAYVAFDDGIPDADDEDLEDSSMRSLDVGVESLSMDDSLLLDGKQPKTTEMVAAPEDDVEDIEAEFVQDTTEASFLIRNCTGDHDPRAIESKEALVVGRSEGADLQVEDLFTSPAHCQLEVSGTCLELTDLDSLNGTWVRLVDRQSITAGSQIRMGERIFSVERRPKSKLSSTEDEHGTKAFVEKNADSNWSLSTTDLSVPIPVSGIRLGRLTGTLVLEDDTKLSSVHACLVPTGDELEIRDFNTKTGSWLRVNRPTALGDGDEILVGETRFLIEKN